MLLHLSEHAHWWLPTFASSRCAILPGLPFLQELVEDKSLAKMVEAGWKPAQKEVERIADELLSTLAYLQEQKVSRHGVLYGIGLPT